MTKQLKLEFELNIPCPKSGVIYDGKFLTVLDNYIKDSGLVILNNEAGIYTQRDLIGIATGYNIVKDKFIIINMNIVNTRFNGLANLDGYLKCLPKVAGTVENSVAIVEKIHSLEVIL